ncbi:flavodoxin family protein [Vibrio algarum]|uniref:flavodoxin family protein n=1 Tax=Vibrio algarum TaxID=3020714 RepID=UPI002B1BDDC3|nr:NAD(P)H-dependent oxidoreductase [Vibrio sp. KJ40-1]
MRDKLLEADALVIGGPNYFDTLNVLTQTFFERCYQFRHQEGKALWGKLAVAVGVGGIRGSAPADQIEKMCMVNLIETVAKIQGQGTASCYTCGYGETCQVGIPAFLNGSCVKFTEDIIPRVEKQSDLMASAVAAGKLLGERLNEGHDRAKVATAVQQEIMKRYAETV